jgi:hypothetical protein
MIDELAADNCADAGRKHSTQRLSTSSWNLAICTVTVVVEAGAEFNNYFWTVGF